MGKGKFIKDLNPKIVFPILKIFVCEHEPII
jgi:hypothetical protein